MPWTRTDYPQSWKNFTEPVRDKAIDIANALLDEQGMTDGRAIPIATAAAERWAMQRDLQIFDDPERKGIEKGPAVHVVPHDEGWAVKPEGQDRASNVYADKRQALRRGRALAGAKNTDLIVHRKDSRFGYREAKRTLFTLARYHVTPHERGWQIRREGADRALETFDTKREAVARGRVVARNQHGMLLIHTRDGQIQTCHSYGAPPERD